MKLLAGAAVEQPLICDIQHFSLHDGPGVRTTVFTKGCSLRCAWCHNPESIDARAQLAFDAARCIGCGACVYACERQCHHLVGDAHRLDRSACDGCMKCVGVCPTRALWTYGQTMDFDRLLRVCLRDRVLYEISGGGVTFSGGECLLQPDLVAKLGWALGREGISLCVDTALNVPWENVERVADTTALFLVDFKAYTPALHRWYTGADNARILENLRALSGLRPYWVRIPVICGVNDTNEENDRMVGFLAELPVKPERIDLLSYHALGEWKYGVIGERVRAFEAPDETRMRELEQRYKKTGCAVYTT